MGVELMACSANEGAASEDRRITRSKQALREAFIELTEENGLDGFSASDLCARAGLNRGTLYNIFGDKDGLLRALEGDIMADLEALQAKMQAIGLKDVMRYRVSKRPMPFLVELFDCLREQGDFLHAVMGPKGDPSFGPRVRDALCTEIIQTILHERYRNNPEPFVQYYVAFYASAYLGVITRWVETGHAREFPGHGTYRDEALLHQTRRSDQAVNEGDNDGRRKHEQSGIDGGREGIA